MKDTRDGSRKTKSYIPMGRLISDILMEIQLIESLTDNQLSKGMQHLTDRILNTKGLKDMGITTEVISPHAELPKEIIHNRRIPLKYFPIFSKPYPLKEVVEFMEKCHAYAILAVSKATSQKKKRKTANKHYERMAKKFKASREHQDTSAEEPRASEVTSDGLASGTIVPYEARHLTVVNN